MFGALSNEGLDLHCRLAEVDGTMSRTNERRITVIVPKEIHQSLKLEAVKQETTVSDIVRELIDSWLAELGHEPSRANVAPSSPYPS